MKIEIIVGGATIPVVNVGVEISDSLRRDFTDEPSAALVIHTLLGECARLKAESASFEKRWCEVAEQYAAERDRRQKLRADLHTFIAKTGDSDDDLRCWGVSEDLREILNEDEGAAT